MTTSSAVGGVLFRRRRRLLLESSIDVVVDRRLREVDETTRSTDDVGGSAGVSGICPEERRERVDIGMGVGTGVA